jgi:6-pyruvoyltetrahydropterin/6-carboxytetrahydropterin synthase
MYLVRIERTFSAAHAIEIRGAREHLHGHDWGVSLSLAGASLDGDGLLVDFHEMESSLDKVVGRFRNRNLNEVPPFDRINPTAELVAQFIAVSMEPHLPAGVHVHSVSVREAPGCTATYFSPFGSSLA